jgi:hypothetical protein
MLGYPLQVQVRYYLYSLWRMHKNICPDLCDSKRSRADEACEVRRVRYCSNTPLDTWISFLGLHSFDLQNTLRMAPLTETCTRLILAINCTLLCAFLNL